MGVVEVFRVSEGAVTGGPADTETGFSWASSSMGSSAPAAARCQSNADESASTWFSASLFEREKARSVEVGMVAERGPLAGFNWLTADPGTSPVARRVVPRVVRLGVWAEWSADVEVKCETFARASSC